MKPQSFLSETFELGANVFLFVLAVIAAAFLMAVIVQAYDHCTRNYPDPLKQKEEDEDDSGLGVFMNYKPNKNQKSCLD